MSPEVPTLEAFLAAPVEQVRAVAPATLVWMVEGTRRSAALAGVDLRTEAYARWTLDRMNECVRVLFHHGVRHVFTPYLTPSHFKELTLRYRERLIDWTGLIVTEPESAALYVKNGWRVRLLGDASMPALRPHAERAVALMPRGEHTLWCSLVAEPGDSWNEVLEAAARSGARTQGEAIRALYGEDIPPATLMIGFGKPMVTPELVPPLIIGKMDCYWTQRPGYRITERELRTVIHDHVYVRRTWRQDKTGRAESSVRFRRAWEEGPTLGLGMHLGPFWYPLPFQVPQDEGTGG
ncbi:hypothetical protein LXT21_15095 [Myxococcus sp. K38C18041901]|uniref:hypothetical protein n=1 Tax=Myxococcus guangdongensis TaxID=2906760 RepID=UPI0020A70E6B|nr:hypothetical protein [Myxococcus guangdongensis]MCP3060108.1 hypothetical protein [Myxococcus guangdongensis]